MFALFLLGVLAGRWFGCYTFIFIALYLTPALYNLFYFVVGQVLLPLCGLFLQ